jgi:hypothetical protein
MRSIWRVLLLGAGTTAVAALALSAAARADDPARSEDLGVMVEEWRWEGPQGTAGAPALREQRDAFWEQVMANHKEFLAGKITPDLLLEADRFCLQADRQCAATPWERAAACRAALGRLHVIHAESAKKLAAGRIAPADVSQVENQMKLVEGQLRADIEEARKSAKNP